MSAISEAQARDYVAGYLDANTDCERFKIKTVGPSVEGPDCLSVVAYVEWREGSPEVIDFVCWLEDDGCGGLVPYGEW